MSSSASNFFPQWIDMGALGEFKKRVKKLQKLFENRAYRFTKGDNQFWLFEEEDEDEIVGGILTVQEGRVYAISQDVCNLVNESFARTE